MKKGFSVFLAILLVISAFAGCGSGKGETNDIKETGQAMGNTDDAGDEATAENASGNWDGEVSHIVVTFVTQGKTPTDLLEVQEKVNEITVPDIGVEVEFKPISIFDTFTQYSLWITSGETVDLMMLLVADISDYSNQGMLQPLDELLEENAPYINATAKEGYPVFDGSYLDGEIYGVVPVSRAYGKGGSYVTKKRYLDNAGLSYNAGEVYTLDQLTEVFAGIKAAYPDMYPCGQITTGVGSASGYDGWGIVADSLGATPASGVLMGTDSTEVVNLFATDEYYDLLKHFKQWYDLGYIHPDAVTIDSSLGQLALTGVTAGYKIDSKPENKADAEAAFGEEMVQIYLCEPYNVSASSTGAFWTIPITSAQPVAAMRFLDYSFSNRELGNLLMWGIEGKHYVVRDEDMLLVDFPEGVDSTTSGYYISIGAWGDRRYQYIWNEGNNREINAAYTERAMEHSTQGVGFTYDTSAMSTELANIDAVLTQYIATLESGSVSNLDAMYQEFLKALEAAGIDEVIEDKQAQFDAWRSQQ